VKTQKNMDNKNIEPFDFKLEILKWELTSIEKVIERMDNLAQASKNWAILIWAGSISLGLGKDAGNYRPIILFFTSIIPILFWLMDSFYRKLQRRSTYRLERITDFLNSENFTKSCESKNLINFIVLDVVGRQYKDDETYKDFVSLKRTLNFAEVKVFYLGLIICSVVLTVVSIFIK